MTLFKPVTSGNAYAKMGVFGETGTGKTYTTAIITIGLVKHLKSLGFAMPPVMFLDTERGSDWVKDLFDAEGITFLAAKTRAFTDLVQAVKEAQAAEAILIIDSISHFWEELQNAFLDRKKKRFGNDNARLEIQDWNIIKKQWATFTELFLNSNCHIFICGRQASVYEFQEDEETGKKSMIASGTRLAAEKGLGYEASILVEMTAHQRGGTRGKKKTIIRRALVLKDRGRDLDGSQFDNPVFRNFLPHFNKLNLGGKNIGIDTSRNSRALFPISDRQDRSIQRQIVLDEIASLIAYRHPGQTAAEKKVKLELLRTHFGVSWTELEKLTSLERLRDGYDTLHRELEGKPSRYAMADPEDLDDEIPDFDKKEKPSKPRLSVTAAGVERPIE